MGHGVFATSWRIAPIVYANGCLDKGPQADEETGLDPQGRRSVLRARRHFDAPQSPWRAHPAGSQRGGRGVKTG